MLRKRKIARLPRPLRHELNRRLADNLDGGAILNWLNALPEVKAVLARDFGGEPIGKQTRVKPGKTNRTPSPRFPRPKVGPFPAPSDAKYL